MTEKSTTIAASGLPRLNWETGKNPFGYEAEYHGKTFTIWVGRTIRFELSVDGDTRFWRFYTLPEAKEKAEEIAAEMEQPT